MWSMVVRCGAGDWPPPSPGPKARLKAHTSSTGAPDLTSRPLPDLQYLSRTPLTSSSHQQFDAAVSNSNTVAKGEFAWMRCAP